VDGASPAHCPENQAPARSALVWSGTVPVNTSVRYRLPALPEEHDGSF
jgi:hypothetical protein